MASLSRFYSEIVLNKYGFSYFSQVIQHILNLGKIRNGPKVASFHLLKRLILFYLKSDFWQILRFQYITLFYCTQMAPNAPEMNKNHLFWVRTHFGCFKPWFGAIVLLFYHSFLHRGYPRPPWSPVVLPGAPMDPWSPHDPWYVILDHCQSSWVIMSPIWPIWSE